MNSRSSRKRPAALYVSVLFLCLMVGAVKPSRASDFTPQAMLTASDGDGGERVGWDVDLDGVVAIAGAPFETGGGAAYIYRFDGTQWNEEQKLTDGAGPRRGGGVAVDGDVAAMRGDGEVIVYRYDGFAWQLEQVLAVASLGFTDVAIDGDRVVASSSHAGVSTADVFRYDGSTWQLEQTLIPSIGGVSTVVAVRGDRILVGDESAETDFIQDGAAFVFEYDGASWQEVQVLTGSVRQEDGRFGAAVSMSGDCLLIGGFGENDVAGAAYVFEYDGSSWTESQRLVSPDPETFQQFGRGVSIEGDLALISAATGSPSSAYVFERRGSTWVESQRLVGTGFSQGVALNGSTAVVGVPGTAPTSQGFAQIYFDNDFCRSGGVNAGLGSPTNVLFVNGRAGSSDGIVRIGEFELIEVTLLQPIAGGNGRFVLHANAGVASLETLQSLPFGIGSSCFPFLLGGGSSPLIVANNIGRPGQVGASSYFGTPTPDPDRATVSLRFPDLPLGTVVTYQALISDPGTASTKGVSLTNAVTIEIGAGG